MKNNQSRLASAGQQVLIPTKATGQLGTNFYQEQSKSPSVTQSLKLLKQKKRHEELREKGYLVNEKEKHVIDMDLPFYEVFDPPNTNYRQIFYPRDLQPMVAYNYHSPDFEQNEIFLVSKEEQDMAEQIMKQVQENERRKEAVLLKINENIKREKEIQEMRIKRQQQNDIIEKIKDEKLNKGKKIKRQKKTVTFIDEEQPRIDQF